MRLPAAIVREAQVHVDQRVRLTVADGQIIVTPIGDGFLTLEQRLAQYDPVRHGGEEKCMQHIGAEKW